MAAALCGPGENAYEQTLGMFSLAEDLLRQAGMESATCAHLDPSAPHRPRLRGPESGAARVLRGAGIDPVPASTGIGGAPVSEAHDLCLGVYAVKAGRPPVRTVMRSRTLNEAVEYGARLRPRNESG